MDPATMARPNKKSRQSGSCLPELAARLTKRLADANPSSNLVFSPLSIYAAVALLTPGARGATLDEVLRLLGARSRDELEESISRMADDALQDLSGSGGPSIAFACGVWNDERRPLKPAYREAVAGTYRAEARTLDFRENSAEAAHHINAWVAKVTRNLINDVVSPRDVGMATDVVLANAIYFKGKWNMPFNEADTRDRPFHRLDGTAVDAPFMYNPARHFIAVHDGFKVLKLQYKMPQRGYQPTQYSMCIFLPQPQFMQSWEPQFVAVHDGFKVLELRYKMAAPDHQEQAHPPPLGHADSDDHQEQVPSNSDHSGHTQFSMCIFLPDAHDGLLGLLDTIASRPGFLQDHLPEEQITLGEFRVPKFKLSFYSSVVAVLKKLGLELPFCLEGDLSDMVEDDGSGLPIVVEDVIHKAVVEVNEEGTEAAAVTMVISGPGCAAMGWSPPPPQVDFIADHPFAYYIVEEATGAVVFAGHVLDPSKE